ncbi:MULTISPECIES: HPr-rel-A system PqqD family peptide chaperone [Sphingomonas]|uniref:HPr-rel-A system PqqD family peptide chaperone n=1 Tax=Sphingomonas TaxID=13687 RepID=UPI000A7E191D|nr:HPr-rel-A system PqqD family peptide chaperone [Sphingomonas sp. CCH10-B3]
MTRFLAADPATLRTVALDELTILYHRASAITHVLAPPAPEILVALAAPLTLEALLARLSADFDLLDGGAEALAARLDELIAAGLVTRA